MVALVCQLTEVGEQACTKILNKTIIDLRVPIPTLDRDGGAEATEATNDDATMTTILGEGTSVLVSKII
jgi:hypothetical protein